MRTLFRIWLTLPAITIALLGAANAQDSSAFDGRYAGVSIIATGVGKCTPAGRIPRPLHIRGGKAEILLGAQAELVFVGPVGTDGTFVLKDDAGQQMTGKIDAMGAVTAYFTDSASGCTYALSWRYE